MNLDNLQHTLTIIGGIAVALPALVSALIAIFMVVPGAQPEKFLKEQVQPLLDNVVSFISKFSKK